MLRDALDVLTTNHYRALKCMFDRRSVPLKGQGFVSITQREVSAHLKVSKPTTIGIIRTLREYGLIAHDENTKGKYYVTNLGEKIVTSFESALQTIKTTK